MAIDEYGISPVTACLSKQAKRGRKFPTFSNETLCRTKERSLLETGPHKHMYIIVKECCADSIEIF